jgi:hypothetical protein
MYTYKSFIAATAALLITSSIVSPVLAGGLEDVFASQNNVRAGIYFRIPFAGGLKASGDIDLSYGFAMGVGRSIASDNLMDPRRSYQTDMVKLSFSSRGFETFNFGGQSLLNRRGVWLGQNEGEAGGMGNLGLVVGGLAAVALGVVALSGGEKCEAPFLKIDGFCGIPD